MGFKDYLDEKSKQRALTQEVRDTRAAEVREEKEQQKKVYDEIYATENVRLKNEEAKIRANKEHQVRVQQIQNPKPYVSPFSRMGAGITAFGGQVNRMQGYSQPRRRSVKRRIKQRVIYVNRQQPRRVVRRTIRRQPKRNIPQRRQGQSISIGFGRGGFRI